MAGSVVVTGTEREQSGGELDASAKQRRAKKIASAVSLLENGPGTEERALGVARLGELGGEHQLVRSASYSRSTRIRAAAATSLGRFGDETDVVRLEALTADAEEPVRVGACRGLGLGPFHDSLELLLDLAEDEGEGQRVRDAAILSAARLVGAEDAPAELHAKFAPKVIATAVEMKASGLCERGLFAQVLSHTGGPEANEQLDQLLADTLQSGCSERESRFLMKAMGHAPPTPGRLELIVQALEGLPGGRTEAARLLGRHEYEAARPALERMLRDPSERLVVACVYSLCALGIGASQPLLAAEIAKDRPSSRKILESLRGPEGAELAAETARSGPVGLRGEALAALVRIDPGKGKQIAETLAEDTNPKVRLAVYETLAVAVEAGSNDAEVWYGRWRNDPVAWVRAKAPEQSPT